MWGCWVDSIGSRWGDTAERNLVLAEWYGTSANIISHYTWIWNVSLKVIWYSNVKIYFFYNEQRIYTNALFDVNREKNLDK